MKSRHCILIEADLRQFNGQKLRIDAWETLCSPVRECDSVGNFNLVSDIFKSKQGKNDTKMMLQLFVIATSSCCIEFGSK